MTNVRDILSQHPLGTPYWPTIADLPYPKKLASVIAGESRLLESWAAADLALAEARDALTRAQAEDTERLREAVRSGAGDPGAADHSDLERALEYAAEAEAITRSDVSLAAERVDNAIREHRVEIIAAAIAKTTAALDEYEGSIRRAQTIVEDARLARRAALDGLAMAAELARPDVAIASDHADPEPARFSPLVQTSAHQAVNTLRQVFGIAD